MTHHPFSELLGPYTSGVLSEVDSRALEEHLESCPECRAELAALRALGTSVVELTDLERARLHAGVRSALGEAPVSQRAARAYRALSAVAAVAIVAVAGIWVTNNLGGSSDDSADSAAGAGGDSGATFEDSSAPAGGPIYLGSDLDEATAMESAADGGAAEQLRSEAPITRRNLRRYATEDPLFRSFTASYGAPLDDALTADNLEALAAQAPADIGDQIRECAAPLLATGRSLPAMAVTGTYEGRRVLVVGIVTATASTGPLDSYTFTVWPKGDCSTALDSISGSL